MTRSFPILNIDRIGGTEDRRGQMTVADLAGLGRRLEASAFRTPAAPLLAAGWLGATFRRPTGLLMTGETRLEPLAYWCANVGARGFSSLLPVSVDDLASAGGVAADDLPLLTGHGVVVASRGVDGEPLVGLEVAELRRQLASSRERLSAICGYEVRVLAPAPTISGRSFDGLVEREARRAGYTLLLTPGGITDIEEPRPRTTVAYRTREQGEDPDTLSDWLLGHGLSRPSARMRRLLSSPKAVMERLAPTFET